MFTRFRNHAPRAIALLTAILSYAAAQPVSAQVSAVFDPVGDTNIPAPAFQDMVGARVTKMANGDFELLMEMAGPVSGAPILPPSGRNQIWWNWVFDLDPTTTPLGYPASPGGALPPEFIIYVSWNGSRFAGTAIDRRPLLTGGAAVVTPVAFDVHETTVEAFLDFTLIGEVPPIFDWRPATLDWAGPLGSGGYYIVDNNDWTEFSGESMGGQQFESYAFDLGHGDARTGARIGSTSKDQLVWRQYEVLAFERLSRGPAVVCIVPRGSPTTTRNPT